jgi:hypothetical protein
MLGRYDCEIMKRSTFGILAVTIALAGCGGTNIGPIGPAPAGPGVAQNQLPGIEVPHRFRRGIYVSTFFGNGIYGYPIDNRRDRPPKCVLSGVSYPVDIAVDGNGNLVVPDGGNGTVSVFKGPKMCGPKLGSFSDPYGTPGDAASNDAKIGWIAVATGDTSGRGSIAVCTLSAGCKSNLTNPNMGEVAGVAMATNGDCWGSATTSTGTATLTYFKRCIGAGEAATGFKNAYYGGLVIDIHGNLVSIDSFASALWIYRGCKPACKVVGGPFPLHGASVFARLNENSTELAAADYACGCVDIYGYSKSGVVYKYSFNNGLDASDDVEGVAFNPRSKE